MTQVEAIFRHGVFEPVGPVKLPEDQRVRLNVEPVQDVGDLQKWLEEVRAIQKPIIERVGILPDSTPDIAADRMR